MGLHLQIDTASPGGPKILLSIHLHTLLKQTNNNKKNLVKCAVSSGVGFHQSLQLYSSHSQTQQESKLLGGPREDAAMGYFWITLKQTSLMGGF